MKNKTSSALERGAEVKTTRASRAKDNSGIFKALEKISGKWKLSVLWALKSGEKLRFSEIKKQIPGINDVMLSQSLKQLIDAGMVDRFDDEAFAKKRYYQLNATAKGILPALKELEKWGGTL